jgi:hypothetical protein
MLSASFSGFNIDLSQNGLGNVYNYYYSSSSFIYFSDLTDYTNNFSVSGNVSFGTLTGFTTKAVNGTTAYWIKIRLKNRGSVIPKANSIYKSTSSILNLLKLTPTNLLNNEYKWGFYNDNIYITIPNSGLIQNEGNTYITSSSTSNTKQNFFIYNNLYLINYKTSVTTLGLNLGTEPLICGAITSSGRYIFTDSADNPTFDTIGTFNDSGAILQRFRRLASDATTGWDILDLQARGNNSVGTEVTYSSILFDMASTTSGSHRGRVNFRNASAGTLSTFLLVDGLNCQFSGKIETTSTATDSGKFAGGVSVAGKVNLSTDAELTIVSGAITITKSFHRVDTEGDAASDDLTTIHGGAEGDILILRAEDSARTVVVKDGGGNLLLAGDFSLDNVQDTITLINLDGTNWGEISRSDNAA